MLILSQVTASSTNVLAGSIFEFIKRPSRVSVAVSGRIVPVIGNIWSFQIGDVVVAQNAVVQTSRAVTIALGSAIEWPKDFLLQNEPALPGDRLVLAITVGSADTIAFAVVVTEVA